MNKISGFFDDLADFLYDFGEYTTNELYNQKSTQMQCTTTKIQNNQNGNVSKSKKKRKKKQKKIGINKKERTDSASQSIDKKKNDSNYWSLNVVQTVESYVRNNLKNFKNVFEMLIEEGKHLITSQ